MLESLLTGLVMVFEWPAIGYLVLGVFLGIWLGAVPGLGGIIGLIILLPFTFDMEPVSAIALLLGMFAVTTTSDTIASIMLGIPGTAASQATILDGYPLAMKGHAARAMGAAFTVSAFGGVFGAVILAISLPLITPIIMAFGSPELFMLGLLGLTMVGSLSGASIMKGLTVALIGLMMAMVGYAETAAIPRYWFGTNYLLDGLPLVPVTLGLFAIPELMDLAIKDVSISRVPKDQTHGGGILDGVRDAYRNWWLVLRCGAIGTYIGMLPGLGASIVDWVAYGHAVQSAKDKSEFGKGDIRGVIAPEAANNAIKGGSLIPAVAFGIPGSLGAAILLGALLIQGIKPGSDMLVDNLHITFSMVWAIVVANILVAAVLMVCSRQLAKVAFIRGHLIVPAVILFVLMGAWMSGASMGDWVTCLVMGAVGYTMKCSGWPRPPLVLAIILGPIMENSFLLSMRTYDTVVWLGRPIVIGIIVLIVLTLVLSTRGIIKAKRFSDGPALGEGAEKNPVISLPFAVVLTGLFIWAGYESIQWPASVRIFPITIAAPATALLLFILFYDGRDLFIERKEHDDFFSTVKSAAQAATFGGACRFFTWLLGILLLSLVVGQMIALPLFIAIYLWRWGGYGWKLSLIYAGVSCLVLYGFYDKILHVFWHPSWLFG